MTCTQCVRSSLFQETHLPGSNLKNGEYNTQRMWCFCTCEYFYFSFFTQTKSWHIKLFCILCMGSFFVLLCILIFISDMRAGSYRGLNPSLAFPLCFAVELNICGTPALAGSASPGTHCCSGRTAEKTCNFLFGSRASCGIDRFLLYYRSYLALNNRCFCC